MSGCHYVTFDGDPRRPLPTVGFRHVARFFEHLRQGALFFGGTEEETYGLVKSRSGLFRRGARAGDIQRHGMGHELVILFPEMDRELNLHTPQAYTVRLPKQSAQET